MELNKTKTKKNAMLAALEKTLGIVTTACKLVDIQRSTFYEWYNEDPEFKKQVDDIQNIAIDFVESKLFENIKNNDTTSTIFYLKTKAKKRGYVEKLEIESNNNHTFGKISIDGEIFEL